MCSYSSLRAPREINLSNSKVRFLGRSMELAPYLRTCWDACSTDWGRPIDEGPEILPDARMDINGPAHESGGEELSGGVYPDRRVCH